MSLFVVCILLGDAPATELYTPTFWNTLPVPAPYLPAYEDGTDRVFETLAYKLQTTGNHPEESIQYSEQGRSLKSGVYLSTRLFILR
jgi:hypothetical protein